MVARRPIGYFLGTLLSLLAQVLISSALPVSARPLAPTIAPTYRLSHFTSHHRSGRRAGRSRAVPAQPRQAPWRPSTAYGGEPSPHAPPRRPPLTESHGGQACLPGKYFHAQRSRFRP